MHTQRIAIIGGGLAGCECALQLAHAGIMVTLFEQKPAHRSPAHISDSLGELVCSNSFRSDELASGVGLLKHEMRLLNSQLMRIADTVRVPAGKALAVDRELFAATITANIEQHPNITLVHEHIPSIDCAALQGFERIVLAAGPLASDSLAASLAQALGQEHLYFYDAIAPIVHGESLDMSVIFRGSRYEEPGQGDYLNCPMNRDEYTAFYEALMQGDKVRGHNFEQEHHFEGCMPIEALAERGEKTLLFGPMKPVGFTDPRTNHRPWAILQLRAENANNTMFNLVGCQTKLTYAAQDRIFRLIPGLQNVDFVRYGSMHRNTYVNAPKALNADLSLVPQPHIHLAGQITGVEGYVESIASGLWLGLYLAAQYRGKTLPQPPVTTALGALLNHLQVTPHKRFQPSNVHFGLMPEPTAEDGRLRKKERKAWYSQRAVTSFAKWLDMANNME